jgi:hypothetical protein
MQYNERSFKSFISIEEMLFILTNNLEHIGILLNSIIISFLCEGHIMI